MSEKNLRRKTIEAFRGTPEENNRSDYLVIFKDMVDGRQFIRTIRGNEPLKNHVGLGICKVLCKYAPE